MSTNFERFPVKVRQLSTDFRHVQSGCGGLEYVGYRDINNNFDFEHYEWKCYTKSHYRVYTTHRDRYVCMTEDEYNEAYNAILQHGEANIVEYLTDEKDEEVKFNTTICLISKTKDFCIEKFNKVPSTFSPSNEYKCNIWSDKITLTLEEAMIKFSELQDFGYTSHGGEANLHRGWVITKLELIPGETNEETLRETTGEINEETNEGENETY